jgi:hypothetical protein
VIEIEIETEGTTGTRTEGQRLPGMIESTMKDRASRMQYESARRNGKFCEGKRISLTIGIGEADNNYRTPQKLTGLTRRQYKSNTYYAG